MKANVISIGNSRGIRIPKTYIDELEIGKEVDIHIENKSLVIQPIKNTPRSKWSKEFKKMAELEEDHLLIPDYIDLDSMDDEWK